MSTFSGYDCLQQFCKITIENAKDREVWGSVLAAAVTFRC